MLLHTPYFINIEFIFQLTVLIFCSGLFGVAFSKTNFLVSLLSAELMYLGLVFGFSIFTCFLVGSVASSLALLLLVVAASESAVGLGILIMSYRFRKSVNFASTNELKA